MHHRFCMCAVLLRDRALSVPSWPTVAAQAQRLLAQTRQIVLMPQFDQHGGALFEPLELRLIVSDSGLVSWSLHPSRPSHPSFLRSWYQHKLLIVMVHLCLFELACRTNLDIRVGDDYPGYIICCAAMSDFTPIDLNSSCTYSHSNHF